MSISPIHRDEPHTRTVRVTSTGQCKTALAKINSVARRLREKVRTPYHSAKLVAGPTEDARGVVGCTYEITYWSRQQIADWQRQVEEGE